MEGDHYVKMQDFGGGSNSMIAYDISQDGEFIVGTGHTQRGAKAFLAVVDVVDDLNVPTVMQLEIEDLVAGQSLKTSSAKAISANGTIIAGTGSLGKRGNRGFVSTVSDFFFSPVDSTYTFTLTSTILPVADGGDEAEVNAMTSDGTIIAGTTDTSQGPRACIWFFDDTAEPPQWQVKVLGALNHQGASSAATGVANTPGSPNGELIVIGHSTTVQDPSEAFIWAGNPVVEDDGIGYFRDLEYILTKTGTGEASGMGSDWVFKDATGISAAGDRIVGWGINPEGGIEAWIVTGYPTMEAIFPECIDAV